MAWQTIAKLLRVANVGELVGRVGSGFWLAGAVPLTFVATRHFMRHAGKHHPPSQDRPPGEVDAEEVQDQGRENPGYE